MENDTQLKEEEEEEKEEKAEEEQNEEEEEHERIELKLVCSRACGPGQVQLQPLFSLPQRHWVGVDFAACFACSGPGGQGS